MSSRRQRSGCAIRCVRPCFGTRPTLSDPSRSPSLAQVREDVLLTPGYPPVYEPTLLRYDQWCRFGDKHFNKLSYKSGFSVQTCKQYFPQPPDLELIDSEDLQELGRELICVEQVAVLNEALCEYHQRKCCRFTPVRFGCHGMLPWRRGGAAMTAEACERSCCDRGGLCSHFVFDEAAEGGPCFHTRKAFRHGECPEGEYPLSGKAVGGKKESHQLTCPTPAWTDVQKMQEMRNVMAGNPDCLDSEPVIKQVDTVFRLCGNSEPLPRPESLGASPTAQSHLFDVQACRDWEARGECLANERYMRRVCPATCRVDGCWDRHYNCRAWAEQGQCEENFQYMIEARRSHPGHP